MHKYLIIALVALGLAACKPAENLESDGKLNRTKVKTVVLSKGSCKGNCPVFELSLNEKGEAIYNGQRHVKIIGEAIATWPDSTTKAIFKKLDAMDFVKLEEEYMTRFTDMATISITYNGKTSKGHDQKLPKEFMDFVKELDALIKETKWTVTTTE